MDEAKLVDAVMEVIEKKGQKPEKMPERILLGRLELLLYLAMIRAEAKHTWEWRHIVHLMATPSLLSQFPEVRSVASGLIVVFYK